jgi:thymidine kinase
MAKLYFYYSAMNAGKSTTMLQAAHNYHERGMRTLIYAPVIDDRHGVGQITSRIGLTAPAIVLPTDHDLYEDVKQRHREKPVHCVLIDEAQFLTAKQVLQATKVCDLIGIPCCVTEFAPIFKANRLRVVSIYCLGQRRSVKSRPFAGRGEKRP